MMAGAARFAARLEAAMLRQRLKRETIAKRVAASQQSLQAAVRRITGISAQEGRAK
jgi:hypothetical protein